MRDVVIEELGTLLAIHQHIIDEKFVVNALIRSVEDVCDYSKVCRVSEEKLPQYRELLQDLHHMELDLEGIVIDDEAVS